MASSPQDKVHESVVKLGKSINHGDIKGTYEIVIATISVLKEIITNTEWTTAKQLMDSIVTNGKHLIKSAPIEACIANMVRRVLKIIREAFSLELKNKTDEMDPQESLHKILTSEGDKDIDFNRTVPSLKSALIGHISELETELETCGESITQRASEHIHANEIVMTLGRSRLVEQFLKKAAETRAFEVIVAEGAPFLDGHKMADNLSKAHIQTTLISDAAIFALMSRVNKVIIGTHTVMADGSLRALIGSHTVALAAKHYSVPVMVLLPMYKLSPLYLSNEQHTFNKLVSPLEGVISWNNTALMEKIQSYNPVFDHVPSDLVSLFISNVGGIAPSYIYSVLRDHYHPDDYDL